MSNFSPHFMSERDISPYVIRVFWCLHGVETHCFQAVDPSPFNAFVENDTFCYRVTEWDRQRLRAIRLQIESLLQNLLRRQLRMSESPGMVTGENVMITGGNFIYQHPNSDTGIEFRNRITIDALHNSRERSNEVDLLIVREIVEKWRPRVEEKSMSSPLSRYDRTDSSSTSPVKPDDIEEVLDDIFTWLYDPRSCSLMVWVYDDENRRETPLVSQVVADILDEREELSASFFFTAESAAGRAETVIPTITHQLAQHIPEAQAQIEAAAHDTALFRLATKEQIRKLIVNPLQAASQSSLSAGRRKFILIHGLEDCNENFQKLFIGYLLDALDSIKDTQFPQKLLLLGRPTNNLRKYFSVGSKVRHCPMSNKERVMCRREERVQGREEDVLQKIEELRRREEKFKTQEQDMERLMEEITQQQELLKVQHNGVRPGCTCREHMPEGRHTERCLSAQNQIEPSRVHPVPAPPPSGQFRSLRGGGGRKIGAPSANSWKLKLKRFFC